MTSCCPRSNLFFCDPLTVFDFYFLKPCHEIKQGENRRQQLVEIKTVGVQQCNWRMTVLLPRQLPEKLILSWEDITEVIPHPGHQLKRSSKISFLEVGAGACTRTEPTSILQSKLKFISWRYQVTKTWRITLQDFKHCLSCLYQFTKNMLLSQNKDEKS